MEEKQRVVPREDYRDETGLLVCVRCGHPKERRLPAMDLFGGKERIVRVLCECDMREQREREEQERLRKAAERAKRLRDACPIMCGCCGTRRPTRARCPRWRSWWP